MPTATDQIDLFLRFGAALIMGFLIGLQREYASSQRGDEQEVSELFAGVRTFALMALLGCGAALASDVLQSPVPFAVVIALAGVLIAIAYYLEGRSGDVGLTTEIAALLTLLVGALCYWDYLGLAAALAVAVTVLLAMKLQTRTLVRSVSREDVYATLKFAVISVIILPVLPRESYGPPPFDVLVPYRIWLMVVFISGIGFVGYLLIKLVGPRRGVGLTGILGGMVSSTAVTLTFSQRSRDAPALAPAFALALLLAWAIMYARIVVEVAVLNASLLAVVWLPLAGAAAIGLSISTYLYVTGEIKERQEATTFKNPFRLAPSITFGLLYAVILLVAHAAEMYLGNAGVYLSSVASGIADVDAITLSMAELSRPGHGLSLHTAARSIVLAAAANTLVKGGIVVFLGSVQLRRSILPGMVVMIAAAVALVFIL